MVIAAAGPASNLVLATIASLLLHVMCRSASRADGGRAWSAVGRVPLRSVQLNVLLAVFNMVPIPPLDGGNVLAGVLRGPVADMYDRLRPYGFLILYALMFTGVLTNHLASSAVPAVLAPLIA